MTRPAFWQGLLSAILTLSCAPAMMAAGDDPYDQSGVPLEVQPTDPSLAKIVLVAGRPSHGPGEHEFFAGCAILTKLLQQNPGVFPVMARDGWPKDPKTFDHAKAVVFYMDGGDGHPIFQGDHPSQIQKLLDAGVGFVNIHYAVEYPKKHADRVLSWLGGYYETGYSTNPIWEAEMELPLLESGAHHPINRGVEIVTIKDEWYYNIRFKPDNPPRPWGKGVTPILMATPPDNTRGTPAAKTHAGGVEVLAWAFERANGGRSFGFTGAHFHKNWGDPNFRRLVVNAILWTAKVEVPKLGARAYLDPADLKKNLDRK